jgi:hypothetical protein
MSEQAAAQALPYQRPYVSPYLNLLNRGQSAGANYYAVVRPDIEFRAGIQRLGQQAAAQQTQIEEASATGLPTTGHPVGFMNHTAYFMNFGTQLGPVRRGTTAVILPVRPTTPTTGAPRR